MIRDQMDVFESKPVFQAILDLALPSVIGQIILVIYNIADTFFVAMSGNDTMITAVTVCLPAFMFLSAISNLFGAGGASVISRLLGADEREKAAHASEFSFWGCAALTGVYSLLAWLFLDKYVDILGGSAPAVHGIARSYLSVTVIIGGVFTALNTLLSHLVRAEGRSFQASIGIIIGGLSNIALDPLFMFVLLEPGNEAFGAALATLISNCLALSYFLIYLFMKRSDLVLSLKPEKKMLDDGIPKMVVSIGLPACLMTLCENISYAVLDNLMAFGGTAAQAGTGIAKKVNMLAHCIVRGMSQGVLPLIGFNFASGDRKRMHEAIKLSTLMSFGVSVLCMVVCLTLTGPLIDLFLSAGEPSYNYGMAFLRIMCVGAPFSAIAYAMIYTFQAVGQKNKSLILALLRKGIIDIPMMFILHYFLPIYGIVVATPVADVVCCVTAIIMFARFRRDYAI